MFTREEILEVVKQIHPEATLKPQTGCQDPVVHIVVPEGNIYIHKFEWDVDRILDIATRPLNL